MEPQQQCEWEWKKNESAPSSVLWGKMNNLVKNDLKVKF